MIVWIVIIALGFPTILAVRGRSDTDTAAVYKTAHVVFDAVNSMPDGAFMGLEILAPVFMNQVEDVINEHLSVNQANGIKRLLSELVPCSLIREKVTLRGQT